MVEIVVKSNFRHETKIHMFVFFFNNFIRKEKDWKFHSIDFKKKSHRPVVFEKNLRNWLVGRWHDRTKSMNAGLQASKKTVLGTCKLATHATAFLTQGSLNYPFGEDQPMQMYGNFGGFPL